MTPARRLLPLLVAIAGLIAYHRGFDGVLLFDDSAWIAQNEGIRVLWPPTVAMGPTFRIFAFYSFAVNYAISGLETWSYHALTLALHILTACAVCGLLARTLRLPRIGMDARRADFIALAVALLWVVHPLNTQAVMYVVQRAEVMMGLAYVLTLYCFLRYTCDENTRRRRGWLAAMFASYALGLGSKEVMATAPVALYLFDALLVTGSLLEPLRRRWRLHAALVAPLVIAPVVFFALDPDRLAILRPNAAAPAALDYVTAQGAVILHYVRSVIWPLGLNFDHAWTPDEHPGSLLPGAAFIALLALATAEAVRRRAPVGFVGAAFLVVLAPTSSVFPLQDYMVEHRMYVPSIAVILGVVLGVVLAGRSLAGRLALPSSWTAPVACGALVIAAASLTALTVRRTDVYGSRVAMWTDVVAKSPHNARGHYNLGLALLDVDPPRRERALRQFVRATELLPTHRGAHTNAGSIYFERGDYESAATHFRAAVRLARPPFDCLNNYGTALLKLGRYDEAIAVLRRAADELTRGPDEGAKAAALQNNIGFCYMRVGRAVAAARHFRRATELAPDWVQGHANLARAFAAQGLLAEAIGACRRVCELQPASAAARVRLARAQAAADRTEDAIDSYFTALALDDASFEARTDILALCTTTARVRTAEAALVAVLARDPSNALAAQCLQLLRARE